MSQICGPWAAKINKFINFKRRTREIDYFRQNGEICGRGLGIFFSRAIKTRKIAVLRFLFYFLHA